MHRQGEYLVRQRKTSGRVEEGTPQRRLGERESRSTARVGVRALEWYSRRCDVTPSLLLLLHQLFAGGLDGDSQPDFCLLLESRFD